MVVPKAVVVLLLVPVLNTELVDLLVPVALFVAKVVVVLLDSVVPLLVV